MIDTQVKAQILRLLLANQGEPLQQGNLFEALQLSFSHVTLTQSDLKRWLRDCEDLGWIAGTNDDLLGPLWGLTAKGQLRAQNLR